MSERTRTRPAPDTRRPPRQSGPRTGPTAPAAALPWWAAITLAALAGLALVGAFPSIGQWWLAPLSLGALYAALIGRRAGTGFLAGWAFGLAFFIPLLSWTGIYVGALPWFALAIAQSLFVGLVGLLAAPLLRGTRPGLWTAVGFAGLWVGGELLRSNVPFGGFPWGLIAFSQSASPLLNLGPWGGTALIGFVTAGLGALAAGAVMRLVGLVETRPHRLGAVGLAALAAVIVPAVMLVPRAPVVGPADGADILTVAGIQGNVTENGLQMGARPREVLENHARLTHDLAADLDRSGREVDLLVWPENASDIDPLADQRAYDTIDDAVRAIGAPGLIGAVRYEPEPYRYNTSFFWDPQQGPVDSYVKQRPVPFAEYIPYRDFFRQFTDLVDLVTVDMAAGEGSGVFDVQGAGVGNLICFEIAYEDTVQQTVRDGAGILVVQTNNATFGHTDESVQQLAMSRVFAVVTGRSVVHVSTVGVSAYYGPHGEQLAYGEHWTPAALVADVPVSTHQTLAVRTGAAWYVAAAVIGLLGTARGIVRGRTWSARSSRFRG